MKIDRKDRFSHPVLSHDTADYPNGSFEVSFAVDEDPNKNELQLSCSTILAEESLTQLIDSETAKIGIDVQCKETYYSEIKPIDTGITNLVFKPGELSGRVSIRPIIWLDKDISGFESSGFHEEYQGLSFDLDPGAVLGWDIEQIISVGQKKFAPTNSIFDLASNDKVKEGDFEVNTEGENISINLNPKTYNHAHRLRQSADGQAIAFNGIYLPALIQILVYLRDGEDEYIDKSWYQSFKAKCDFYNLDLKNADVLSNALTLLKSPYLKIMERFNE